MASLRWPEIVRRIYILAGGAPPPCIPRQGKIAPPARFPLNPFSPSATDDGSRCLPKTIPPGVQGPREAREPYPHCARVSFPCPCCDCLRLPRGDLREAFSPAKRPLHPPRLAAGTQRAACRPGSRHSLDSEQRETSCSPLFWNGSDWCPAKCPADW